MKKCAMPRPQLDIFLTKPKIRKNDHRLWKGMLFLSELNLIESN